MNRKVIFLGAGASCDAGYPLTSELYDLLKRNHENSYVFPSNDAWEQFDESLRTIKNDYPVFSSCKNIEYLITLLSLPHKLHEKQSEIKTLEQARDVAIFLTPVKPSSPQMYSGIIITKSKGIALSVSLVKLVA